MTEPTSRPAPNWIFTPRKFIAVLFISALILAYVHGPTEAEILSHQTRWKSTVDANPWLWGSVFLALEITLIALSVPVASGLMLVCGFLFGRWRGVLLMGLGAPIGALLAMLTSRYFFHGLVRRIATYKPRLRQWIVGADRGIEREGWYYLLLLRLTPVVPFFVINLAMGLTRIRSMTFFWVTLVGMFPATLVFVNAGASAGDIRSAKDLVSLETLLALMLLILFPIVLRIVLPRPRDSA